MIASALPAAPSNACALAEAEAFETPTRPIEIPQRLRNRGVLVEMLGPHAGRPHPLFAETATIGRGRGCDVQLLDETLSRVHARIVRRGNQFAILDARSLNGCIVNDERVSERILTDGDRVRLGALAELRFNLVSEEEERTLRALYEGSTRDALTGVANRKQLEQHLAAEVAFAVRHKTELSLVMIDIDHFKQVNDTYGHPVGDDALRKTARLLGAGVRTEDLVARYGGEEFVVVARGVPLDGARLLAERLRGAIAGHSLVVNGRSLRLTASFGVASLACGAPDVSMVRLVACADQRLYAAKVSGRNRVVAA